MTDILINETRSATRYNDISTVYADLVVPDVWPGGHKKICDVFSCFSDHYAVGKEREFIETLVENNPGKYKGFRIKWSDCN